MRNLSGNLLDISYLDTLAAGDSPLHRLDPRAKLIVTIAFIIAVVSFDRYTISALMPFGLYPVVLTSAGRIPAMYLLKKIFLVAPFAVMVGIFNPLIDTTVLYHIGPWGFSGGWVSLVSILLRFCLTVAAALALLALTGFNAVCESLLTLGMPRPFVVQLSFFYRYMFVLGEEAGRVARARSLRSFDGRAMGLTEFGSFSGHLLLRTLDRAERIYRAMCCRGFDGHVPALRRMRKGVYTDVFFVLGWLVLFFIFRYYDPAGKLGAFMTGVWR